MIFNEEQKKAIKYLYANIDANIDSLVSIELISYDLTQLGKSLKYKGRKAILKGSKYKNKTFECLGISYTLGDDLYLKFDVNGVIGSINMNLVKFI